MMQRRRTVSILLTALLFGCVVPGILADTGTSMAPGDHVDVYNCVATPNTVEVTAGKYLRWNIPDTPGAQDASEYRVIFDPLNNPLPNTVPLFSLKRTDPPHQFNAPACTKSHPEKCPQYLYKLRQTTQDGGLSDCPDPIIRVVPPSLVGYLILNPLYGVALLALIALLSYAGFRIFSRNRASSLR